MNRSILAVCLTMTMLFGCANMAGQKKVTQEQAIEISCNTIALGNSVIAQGIRLGKIKGADTLDKIQKAKDYVHPICNPDSGVYPTLSELAMAEFKAKAAELAAAKAQAEK